MEGVVMTTQPFLSEARPPHLGKGRHGHDHMPSPSSGKESDGHGHKPPTSSGNKEWIAMVIDILALLEKRRGGHGQRPPPSSGNGKGWSWPRGEVVMTLDTLPLLEKSGEGVMALDTLPLLEKG